jgi:hypothetical protein
MTITTDNRLQDQCEHIASQLTDGFGNELNEDGQEFSAFDYLQDALDIQYTIGSDKRFIGARVLVAFGGPNIWINTITNEIEGYWWGESSRISFQDSIGLNDALEELYNC